ncbi:MAG: glycosyltransferase family 2 protein [Ignavibacteria bacterium]|nr:glycosyltransferase family 2 protein [Ignavibacteria bacterium]
MQVSVIICTYKRYELLRLAVDSLINQTASKDLFEVLIIENDIKESKEIKEITEYASKQINIRKTLEPSIGLSNARNKGIKEAKGGYLWFLDDDAKANPDYILNLNKIIDEIHPDVCGGPYFPFYLTDKPKWFKDEYGTNQYNNLPRMLNDNEYLSGGNIVFKNSFFNEYGFFDTSLGMKGNSILYGEETYLQIIARKKNTKIVIYGSNDLFIYHFVSEDKMKIRDRILRSFKLGYSHTFMDDNSFKKFTLLYYTLKTFVKIAMDISICPFSRKRENYIYLKNYYYEVTARKFSVLGNLCYKLTH